ncbi:MAG: 4Fe-4S dicluster domain-containing protein [Zoogloeaceae bacterium]|jgi:Fe-S oxidoreductase/electron transfer flavoprotein alpha/beta subunit/nitrate reductase gamma subunit|nr:4Fe-4S dicluster domain-containing protein [Zoogloeaceae bacterium]
METRALFWGLESFGITAFYLIGFAAIGAFLWGVARAVGKYRRGRPSPVKLDLRTGFLRMAAAVASHRALRRRDQVAGAAHALVFFGFAALFLGTAIITLEYDILEPLFGVTYWKGMFFKAFSLTVDIAGLLVLAGVLLLMLRRGTAHSPEKLDYRRAYLGETELRPAARRWQVEDWVFLVAILVIIVSGFTQEGLRHAMERPAWGGWEPVGAFFGLLFANSSEETLRAVRAVNWWFHGLAALAFIVALPWYKAKHIFAAMGALAARDPLALSRLPAPAPEAETAGAGRMSDFSWKDMLDFDACTKCGRCHEACPARTAGYPLSPRDFILDLRLANDMAQGRDLPDKALIGGVIDPETLWSCRACGACLEICPVGIEHPVKIVKMRRQLVENDCLDPLLRNTLSAIGASGNSFGEPARKRAAWTKDLGFTVKDIRRQAADLLWFVGDQASFDPRGQQVSRAVARIFKAARVDFALLHEGEKTAGNDARRVGEEGLFEALAEHNLGEMARAKSFQRIVTTDPHTFNTLHNEYPEFGAIAPVIHYTELLCDLLESGALKVKKPLRLKVTFHDPCHLGRLNKRYDAPRRVLALIGCELVEMPRNRDNAFCCGAGGGRMWMPDKPGTQKPSELRIREAAELLPLDVFVTCCPKDLIMFEDARKTAGFEKDFVVEDIAELVARAIELDAIALQDLPGLTERIAAAVAQRVASVVVERLDKALAGHLPAPAIAAPAGTPAPAAVIGAPAASGVEWQARPVTPARLPAFDTPARNGARILVPVKRVGALGDDFSFTDDRRGIPAEFFEYQLNEWDDTALEQALRTVEALGGGEVVVVSVGPAEAGEILRKALAKGAHRGIRVWDAGLEDADPIAIARLLAAVALREKPDLIFMGGQSGDQANAATGAALARLLDLPRATLAVAADWDGGEFIRVKRELEGGLLHEVELPVPALVTLQTGANTPRYATMRMIKQAREKPVVFVDASGEDAIWRAARIERLSLPQAERAAMLEGGPDEVAARVIAIIREKMGETI